jgi:hypothetical protein
MIVTVDGQVVRDGVAPESTLQELIDRVTEAHLGQRLVVAVALNGRRLDEADLNASLERPVETDVQVDLESAERRSLVRDVLRGLGAEFREIQPQIVRIADRLGGDGVTEAIRDVGDLVALWQSAYRAIGQCGALLGEDLLTWSAGGEPVREHLQRLVNQLVELRGALSAGDVVLLADLLRYEMQPAVQRWQGLFDELAAHAEQNGPGA